LFRAILPLLAILLTACGGGGSKSGSGGGGGTPTEFAVEDRAGIWKGELTSNNSATVPFGMRFAGNGDFQRLGEFYTEYTVAIDDVFSANGQLELEVSANGGTQRFVISGRMADNKTSFSGTWQRFEGGAATTGSGDFTATLSSGTAEPSDLAGDWSGEMMSTWSFKTVTSCLSAGTFGQPSEFCVQDVRFTDQFDILSTSLQGNLLRVEIENLATMYRYELVGSLNTQGTIFVGQWALFDLFSVVTVAEDQGVFEFQLALDAAPRELSELAGTWSGEVEHAIFGTGVLELEIDAQGVITGGDFDEFGGPSLRIIDGVSALDQAQLGDFSASFDDEFSKFGSDEIKVFGVLSPLSPTWTGRFEHYFYGTAPFKLTRN